MPPRPLRRLVPSFALLAVAMPVAAAVESADEPTVVVTATRLEDAPIDQPYALHIHTREELDRAGTRTLIDALSYTPGVYVQRTAANQASPYIRGLTGEQSLILFDGVRLNHAMFRGGPNQYAAMIPDEAVDRVDVILGSGTTVMGSDGLTGAIDFRMVTAGRGVTQPMSTWIEGRAATAEGYRGAGGVDGRLGSWAWSIDGSWLYEHDLEGGDHARDRLYGPGIEGETIPNSSYRQYTWGARTAYLGLEGQRLELSLGRSVQRDAPRADGYFANSNTAARISRYFDSQSFDYAHLRHTVTDLGPFQRIQATAWFHRQGEVQVREDISSNRYRRQEYQDEVRTVGADLQVAHRIDDHALTWGGTGYQDTTSNIYTRWRSPTGVLTSYSAVQDDTGELHPGLTSVPDGSRYRGLACFAQDDWRIGERWGVLAGARYDNVSWKVPISGDRAGYSGVGTRLLEDSAEAVTAQARLSWSPADPMLVFVGAGQGFRAPNLSNLAGARDRASSSSGGNGPQTEGNPDLEPERSLTLETGWKYEHAKDTASLTLFRTEIEDLIETQYIDVNGDGAITTADRARSVNGHGALLWGWEAAFDYGLPLALPAGHRLSVFQSTSAVAGKVDVPAPDLTTHRENLSRANLLFGRAGIQYEDAAAWYAQGLVRWSGRYDQVAPGDATDTRQTTVGYADGTMPGWAVIDLKAGWHTPDRSFHIEAGIENIGDLTYRAVGSGTDGAGRNLVVSGGARF